MISLFLEKLMYTGALEKAFYDENFSVEEVKRLGEEGIAVSQRISGLGGLVTNFYSKGSLISMGDALIPFLGKVKVLCIDPGPSLLRVSVPIEKCPVPAVVGVKEDGTFVYKFYLCSFSELEEAVNWLEYMEKTLKW